MSYIQKIYKYKYLVFDKKSLDLIREWIKCREFIFIFYLLGLRGAGRLSQKQERHTYFNHFNFTLSASDTIIKSQGMGAERDRV